MGNAQRRGRNSRRDGKIAAADRLSDDPDPLSRDISVLGCRYRVDHPADLRGFIGRKAAAPGMLFSGLCPSKPRFIRTKSSLEEINRLHTPGKPRINWDERSHTDVLGMVLPGALSGSLYVVIPIRMTMPPVPFPLATVFIDDPEGRLIATQKSSHDAVLAETGVSYTPPVNW